MRHIDEQTALVALLLRKKSVWREVANEVLDTGSARAVLHATHTGQEELFPVDESRPDGVADGLRARVEHLQRTIAAERASAEPASEAGASGLRAGVEHLKRTITSRSGREVPDAETPAEESALPEFHIAGGLAGMSRRDAIRVVLRSAAPQALRARDIVEAMERGGRPGEASQDISFYLSDMYQRGQVLRVDRGLYTLHD